MAQSNRGLNSNYAIKRDLRENPGFKSIIGRVGPLFWLLDIMLRFFSFLLLAALSSSAFSSVPSELEQLTAKRFKSVSSIKRLPPEVMAFVSERNIGEISDVSGPFWASDACCFPNQPPSRRLVLAGYNRNFIYVYYEQGGRGLTLHFVAFKRENGNASLIYHSRFGNHQRSDTQKKLFSFLVSDQPPDESEQIEKNNY